MTEEKEYSEKELLIDSIRRGVINANKANSNALGVILYGSRSRNTHKPDSDADLLIILEESRNTDGIIDLRESIGLELRRLGIITQYNPRGILQRSELEQDPQDTFANFDMLDNSSTAIVADRELENEVNDALNELDQGRAKILHNK